MNKRIPFFLGFLLVTLALWVQITSVDFIKQIITRLNNMAYDTQLRAKLFAHPSVPTTPIAIVDIDDKSLKIEGRWPWPRSKLATLINQLGEDGAVVIALDIMFSEKESNITETVLNELTKRKINNPNITTLLTSIAPNFDNDSLLANSFTNKDVVLGMTFLPETQAEGMLPPPLLTLTTAKQNELPFIDALGVISNITMLQNAGKYAGFINAYADHDGIIRRAPLLMRYHNNLYPSLAFEAVQLYLLSHANLITAEYDNLTRLEAIQLGNHRIPTDSEGYIFIPYRGKAYTFPYYSATGVLNKTIPKNALDGKIIFLGTSAIGVGDLRAVAIQAVFPGIEIQATIADGILSNNFSYRPAWTLGAELAFTALLGFALLLFFPYLGPRDLTLWSLFIPLILVFINNWITQKTGLILYILIPILLCILLATMNMVYGYLFESRRREHLKEMFGQYVPKKHIDEMLRASGSYGLYGEDRDMTVLFADIRNFTSISEHMSASELKDMLNEFFTPMTEIIFNHHGTIDKYIGDLIMAFWGAPLKDKKHAQHAMAAALEMQAAVERLTPAFRDRGWPDISIGIGLNTGIMSVGDMGSKFRRNYTVLGDAVNLASRVEGLTKIYGVKIIVAEKTHHDQRNFAFRQLDRVRVKGKKKGVAIYELVCSLAELTQALEQEIKLSEEGINAYFNQEWDKANEIFKELQTEHPHKKLYHLYLDRIAAFKLHPPPHEWDGIHAHITK